MSETRPKNATVWSRDPLDWYVEAPFVTSALAKVERFVGPVLDPTCGQGNIVQALIGAGVEAFGSDVKRRVPDGTPWYLGERDFLEAAAIEQPNICMNPPFFRAKGTEQFIRHALAVARGKVAVFADIKFLASDRRASGLFAESPPHRIWSISPRPSCPPGDYLLAGGVAAGGTADWLWLIWSNSEPYTGTTFGWLRADRVAP